MTVHQSPFGLDCSIDKAHKIYYHEFEKNVFLMSLLTRLCCPPPLVLPFILHYLESNNWLIIVLCFYPFHGFWLDDYQLQVRFCIFTTYTCIYLLYMHFQFAENSWRPVFLQTISQSNHNNSFDVQINAISLSLIGHTVLVLFSFKAFCQPQYFFNILHIQFFCVKTF